MDFHRSPITFVSHVHLKVLDIERSLRFYQDVLGFKIYEKSPRAAKLTTDGTTVLLSIEQPQEVTPTSHRTTGLYHLALLLPNRSDLGRVIKHLLKQGYPLQGAADHLVSEALYLADPDGNGIEIYSDRDPSKWIWRNDEVVMPSDPLEADELLEAASESTWDGLPSGTLLGHIHLHVNDMSKNLDFYVEGLGFEVVSRYGEQASFISDGKYHHHIALNTWNGVGAPPAMKESVGLKFYTINFSSKEKRDRIVSRLQAIGAMVDTEHEEFITTDPSGNRIHLSY